MDVTTFEDLLDRYGGDDRLWPAAERAAAQTLLASSPPARAALAAMNEVEDVLRQAPRVETAAGVDAIVARATRHRQETRARIVAMRAGWATAAAAVLALGLVVGGQTPSPDSSSPDRVVAAAFDAGSATDVE